MRSVRTRDVSCNLCGGSDHKPVARTKDFCYGTCDNEFDYVECGRCHHVYLKNRPIIEELGTIYPNTYLTYDYEEYLGGFINSIRQSFQKMRVRPISRYAKGEDGIIDVGCGGGDLLSLIKKYGDPQWRLYGVDFSPEAVERLRQRGIEAVQSRFEELEWSGPEVGVILMMQLIEHVESPKESLSKAFQILRQDGVLILETPSLDSWDAKIFKDRYWGGWHAPRHWSLFRERTLAEACRDCGFEIAEINYTLSPFSWLHSLQYKIRDKWGYDKLARQFDVDKFLPLCAASAVDVVQRLCHGKTGNMQMIVRKPDRAVA